MYEVVREAAEQCWSKKGTLLDKLKAWMDANAAVFINAPPKPSGGEQDLEMYTLFQEYTELYEQTLSDYVKDLGVREIEFFRELDAVLNDPNIKSLDKKLVHFANFLIAFSNYEAFYKVMLRAAKRIKKADAKADSKSEPSTPNKAVPNDNNNRDNNDAKADSKSSSNNDDYPSSKANYK